MENFIFCAMKAFKISSHFTRNRTCDVQLQRGVNGCILGKLDLFEKEPQIKLIFPLSTLSYS